MSENYADFIKIIHLKNEKERGTAKENYCYMVKYLLSDVDSLFVSSI
jgi:hypothetical protein